jgi:hypothetical protein
MVTIARIFAGRLDEGRTEVHFWPCPVPAKVTDTLRPPKPVSRLGGRFIYATTMWRLASPPNRKIEDSKADLILRHPVLTSECSSLALR